MHFHNFSKWLCTIYVYVCVCVCVFKLVYKAVARHKNIQLQLIWAQNLFGYEIEKSKDRMTLNMTYWPGIPTISSILEFPFTFSTLAAFFGQSPLLDRLSMLTTSRFKSYMEKQCLYPQDKKTINSELNHLAWLSQ